MITKESILKDLKIIEEATPAPWYADTGNGEVEATDNFRCSVLVRRDILCDDSTASCDCDEPEGWPLKHDDWCQVAIMRSKLVDPNNDLEFAAAARNNWPLYIAEVKHLNKVNQELVDENLDLIEDCRKLRHENETLKKLLPQMSENIKKIIALEEVAEAAKNILPFLASRGFQWDSDLFQAIKKLEQR